MPKKGLSHEDTMLFRSAVGETTRLEDDKFRPGSTRPSPHPKCLGKDFRISDPDMLSDAPYEKTLTAGQSLLFSRNGISQRVTKQLRKGHFTVERELDLHGKNVDEARVSFACFIDDCITHKIRCARIIHGKGFRSKGGYPIIKSKLERWLRLRREVLAFSSALPRHGGTGAVYVLLRRKTAL